MTDRQAFTNKLLFSERTYKIIMYYLLLLIL